MKERTLQQMIIDLLDKGWTQTQIAKEMGYASPSAVSRIYRKQSVTIDWRKRDKLIDLHRRAGGAK